MDVNTGHLVSAEAFAKLLEGERANYKPVPFHLREEAERALDGQEETTVNLNLQTNLATWAAKERKKNRVRAKMAKKSRARNRK